MNIGAMRHRLTVQECIEDQSPSGADKAVWSDVATIWGSLGVPTGRLFYAAQQWNASVNVHATIRYQDFTKLTRTQHAGSAGLSPAMRLKFGARVFQVIAFLNREERNREIDCLLMEMPIDGAERT